MVVSNQWTYVPKFYRIFEQGGVRRSSNLIFYFTNRETETHEQTLSLSLSFSEHKHTHFWVLCWVIADRKCHSSGLRKRKGKWRRTRPVVPPAIRVCVAQLQGCGPTIYPCFKNRSGSPLHICGQNFTKLWNKPRITMWVGPDYPMKLSVLGSYWGHTKMEL